MYQLTWKDGSKTIAYLKNFFGRTYFVDQEGYELIEEGWIGCEKV